MPIGRHLKPSNLLVGDAPRPKAKVLLQLMSRFQLIKAKEQQEVLWWFQSIEGSIVLVAEGETWILEMNWSCYHNT
jgi:hypothetical protein